MGAADSSAAHRGADDRHSAECGMGGACPGQALGGRLGIAGLARGRLSSSTVDISGLGRTSAGRGACGLGPVADLGCASTAAASGCCPDLGFTRACVTAVVDARAVLGCAGCPAARVTSRRRARSVMGSSFGSGTVLGCAARAGSGRPLRGVGSVVESARSARLGCRPRRFSRTRASRRGGAGPGGQRLGRAGRGPILGGTARSSARSAADGRAIVGRRNSRASVRAACARVGPARHDACLGASAD
jgi:hypothetical protein